MRHFLLTLLPVLLFAGCHPQTPEPTTPKPPVQKPHFETETPQSSAKAPDPVKRDPGLREETEGMLMFMIVQLDLNLAEAMEMCVEAGGEALKQIDGKDHWFNCGGREGYIVAVDDDGKVVYCAVAEFEGWTLPMLREILGREDKMEIGDAMAETHWYKSPSDGAGPELTITLNVPKGHQVGPFVSMKFSRKSAPGLSL